MADRPTQRERLRTILAGKPIVCARELRDAGIAACERLAAR